MIPTRRAQPVVVFFGNFAQGTTDSGLRKGMQEVGWKVHSIDRQSFEIRADSMLQKVFKRAIRKILRRRMQCEIIAACRDLRPDVFFTVKGAKINVETINELQSLDVACVCFYPDYHFDYPDLDKKTIFLYDFFFTTKHFQLNYLREGGYNDRVYYLPHGYCPDTHQPIMEINRNHDQQYSLQYIGNRTAYKEKNLMPTFLKARHLRRRIIGEGWQPNNQIRLDNKFEITPGVRGIRYAKAIQEASVNVAIHMGPAKNGWQDTTSTRTFEIPACGGFMLHVDNPEVREMFSVGKEIDVFSSSEELLEKVFYYLRNPSMRESMAIAAYRRAKLQHSYNQRAKDICSLLCKRI